MPPKKRSRIYEIDEELERKLEDLKSATIEDKDESDDESDTLFSYADQLEVDINTMNQEIQTTDLNVTNLERSSTNLNTSDQGKLTTVLNYNLKLGWSLRNDLINNLIQFSCLLSRKKIEPEEVKSISSSHQELVVRLWLLTPTDNENENIIYIEDDLNFELNRNLSTEIINLLREDFSCLLNDKNNNTYKENLISENNRMACLLIKLKLVSKSSKADNRIEVDQTLESNEISDKIIILEKKIDEFENLKRKINEMDIDNLERKFHFEIQNIQEIKSLNVKNNYRLFCRSETFYCSSIPFYLYLKVIKTKKNKYLDLYLHLADEASDTLDCKVEFSLIVYHPNDSSKNMLNSIDVYTLKKRAGRGFTKFINFNDLDKYAKDDKIQLCLKMKADVVYHFDTLNLIKPEF